MDSGVVRQHFRVSGAVTAFAFVDGQILAHRLPGGRPVVPAFIVPDVEVATGLIEAVEDVAQDPTVGTGLSKAVAAGVVGNQCAVGRASQVVGPGGRGRWVGDDVFPIPVVKIAVVHGVPPCSYACAASFFHYSVTGRKKLSKFAKKKSFLAGTDRLIPPGGFRKTRKSGILSPNDEKR